MKIYTSLKSIPELSNLPAEEREIIWRQYKSNGFFHWKIWVAIGFCIMFQFGIYELKYLLRGLFPDIHRRYMDFPAITIGLLISFLIIYQVLIRVVRPYMAKRKG